MLKTGKDESGQFLPLYINMFGDYRPSGYHYLTIIPIAIFGLSEFATRFPAAVFGALSVFAIYFLTFALFKDKKISLVSALLLAIAPWHVVLSRASGEAIIALFFILIGFAFFVEAIKSGRIRPIIMGFIIAAISFFFYHTPRVFVPLLFMVLIAVTFHVWRKYSTRFKATLFVSFIVVSLLAFFLVFEIAGGTGRFSQVNIFKSFETDFQLQQEIGQDVKAGTPKIISRAAHNKVSNIGYMFVSNYIDYFGGSFLFMKGGLPIWYSIPRTGILYLFSLPFILYGVYVSLRQKGIYYKIPLIWLLVGPLVAAITLDDIPNINRASVMFPMFEIVAAIGIVNFFAAFKKDKKKYILCILLLLLIFSVSQFLFQYFVNAKYSKPWYRNNGFSQMIDIVKEKYNDYDYILLTKHQGGIYPLVLFYMKYDPLLYQSEGSPKTDDYERLGKIIYVPQDCPYSQYSPHFPQNSKMLFIEDGSCPIEKNMKRKLVPYQYVDREDGTPAFLIVN
jgi:4-amino-4-deoxy-L-arabinose transferase-like glycosyltransferase